MGSCISKCRPRSAAYKEFDLPQDKLEIPQASASASPQVLLPNKPSSHSPFDSPSSSSFSYTTSFTNSSSSLSTFNSSPCSTSLISSKDRAFSNEFLWACIKENPQIVQTKPTPIKALTVKPPLRRFEAPSRLTAMPLKQSIPPRRIAPQPQKRGRDSSPTLVRQKSLRRELAEKPNSPISSLPSRTFSSPSPSRRFNGDEYRAITRKSPQESCRRNGGFKTNVAKPTSLSGRKENLRPRSPSNNVCPEGTQSRKRETSTHHIRPGIDQNAVGELLSQQELNSLITGIDNPFISLDCFIFL
ncbi:PREDICTED: uncharacterized protein LOC104590485 [Nelumbo nucifera]|uniref:Uncharacterized protein LOC104590485 n=2 Tax=Nelumbo nucifera TaxID=4432 RepID=A0A1U7Z8V8_NELNU|nr:PREDICTED: uncharacterized protein LOC104590485 [Nelumbo nucifera]DAD24758.1 TPA_asm: hypothetical protein HUJ06_026222 [Nelumbo nucifera]